MFVAIFRRLARLALIVSAAGALSSTSVGAVSTDENVLTDIDLSGPFSTQSTWRLTVFQGPSLNIPDFGAMPGQVRLCLRATPSGECDPQLQQPFEPDRAVDMYSYPHYLKKVQIVQDASGRPLLLLRTASLPSADGDEFVFTQALAYQRGPDTFSRVYGRLTGRNNNQDVRFIDDGPLKGDIISVEPTNNAPFGYWVSVNAPAPDGSYKEILRYRSATTYNDGNSLAVIDSEMPNMQKRLGVWKPGIPLPLPAEGCAKPRLVKMALWCN